MRETGSHPPTAGFEHSPSHESAEGLPQTSPLHLAASELSSAITVSNLAGADLLLLGVEITMAW
eukprot:3102188-Rhodomonas_salina.1